MDFAARLSLLFDSVRRPNGKRWTLHSVARETGLSVSYLWMLKKGKKKNPTQMVIKNLARVFDVPTDFFLSPDPRLPGQAGSDDGASGDLVARHTLELARKSYDLAGQAYTQRRFHEALSRCEQALFLLRESGCQDTALELKILYGLGILYSVTGNPSESTKHYTEALALARETGDNERVGTIYMGLGNVFLAQGDYAKSLTYSQRALEVLVQLGLTNLLASLHHNIGEAYAGQGQWDLAAKFLHKSLASHRAAGDEIGAAQNLKEIARYLVKKGEGGNALAQAQEALETFVSRGHRKEAGQTQMLTGQILETLGRWDEAVSAYQKAVELFGDAPLEAELGAAFARLGYALARKGEGPQADQVFRKAFDNFHTTWNAPVADLLPV